MKTIFKKRSLRLISITFFYQIFLEILLCFQHIFRQYQNTHQTECVNNYWGWSAYTLLWSVHAHQKLEGSRTHSSFHYITLAMESKDTMMLGTMTEWCITSTGSCVICLLLFWVILPLVLPRLVKLYGSLSTKDSLVWRSK